LKASQASQVDTALGVTGSDQDAAGAGSQAGDVALAADQVIRAAAIVDGDLNGARAVEGGGASGDAGAGVDVGCERGRGRIDIVAGHRLQVEAVADGRRHGQANQ